MTPFRVRDWRLNKSFLVEAGVSPLSSHGRGAWRFAVAFSIILDRLESSF